MLKPAPAVMRSPLQERAGAKLDLTCVDQNDESLEVGPRQGDGGA
jgi:hypothetical protein